jgi:mannan endo-1,4-beta-mannosidase
LSLKSDVPGGEVPGEGSGPIVSRRKLLACAVPAALALSATPGCQRPAPRLFGLALSGLAPSVVQSATQTAATLGRRLDVLNVYQAFSWQQPLPTDMLHAADAAGVIPEITWEPWDPDGGVNQPLYSLPQVAGGRHDPYIAQWARDAAAYPGQLLLRFAHEMNGSWYPWSVGMQGSTTEDYVAAYRRVRRIFDDAGAERVQWVWSPNVILGGNSDVIRRSFPGEQFVDIVGVDGYNWGSDGEHQWQRPVDLFAATLDLVNSIAPHKPVWINEVGCAGRGGDKAAWITELGQFLSTTSVRGLVWFNLGDPGEPDWRLTATAQSTAAAKAMLGAWR